jgi:hypothetical protein
VDNS